MRVGCVLRGGAGQGVGGRAGQACGRAGAACGGPQTRCALRLPSCPRSFWKNITLSPPLYGADVLGSLFDEKLKGWNLRRLDTLLSKVLEENGFSLPGVNAPYLYFGSWRSVFAW